MFFKFCREARRIGTHPTPVIGDFDLDRTVVAAGGHGTVPPFGREFDGVEQQDD